MMMRLHRVLAVNPPRPIQTAEQFWGYIADNYYSVLSTLRCPCSGEAKPCPSGQFLFDDAIEQKTMSNLHTALGSAITAIQKNYTQITDASGPRAFFETLRSAVHSQQVALDGTKKERDELLDRLDEILAILPNASAPIAGCCVVS